MHANTRLDSYPFKLFASWSSGYRGYLVRIDFESRAGLDFLMLPKDETTQAPSPIWDRFFAIVRFFWKNNHTFELAVHPMNYF